MRELARHAAAPYRPRAGAAMQAIVRPGESTLGLPDACADPLHDTRTGEVRPLEPREPGRVGIYACGPTVYGRIHVGNARPFVVVLAAQAIPRPRGLSRSHFVANITDINDKIYAAAQAQPDVASAELAAEMTAAYVADTDRAGARDGPTTSRWPARRSRRSSS